MRIISILLKKDIKDRTSNFKNTKNDIIGVVLSIILTLFVVGVFVFAFSYFTDTYSNIKIGYLTNKSDRVFEILTIYYFLLLILLTALGITKFNKSLTDVGNKTLLSMPITPFQIFISKIAGIYLDLFITGLIVSIPVFIMLVVSGLLGIGSIFIAIIFMLIIPIIALGIASIFIIPYYFIRKWLSRHVAIQLITYTIFMIGAFFVYSIFLRFIKSLIQTGQISFFFNENNIIAIGIFCKKLFPINLLANIFIGQNVALNILLMVVVVLICAGVCFYVTKFFFEFVSQNKIGKIDDFYLIKQPRDKKNPIKSLILKEYLNVLRTPNLAFSYFAIVVALPIMVVVTSSIMSSMMRGLTMLNCDFEIALCSICMYSILLNSFCANNISRDGKFFNLLKTYPLSSKQVIFSKLIFCGIVSVVSIVLSGLSILVAGIISPLKVLAVVVICLFINFGTICLATRKDLNSTKYQFENENKGSTNFLIFWGLIFSIIITIISFVLSLYFQTKFNLLTANLILCGILLVIGVILFSLSLIYLLKNLDKKYKETVL